jgi:hypothetical protein
MTKINTFAKYGSNEVVSIVAASVVCFYADRDNEAYVNIELVNGSKFTVKSKMEPVRKWIEGI